MQDIILYTKIAILLKNTNLWTHLELSNPYLSEEGYVPTSECTISTYDVVLLNIECKEYLPGLKWFELFTSVYDIATGSDYYSQMNENNDLRMLLYKPVYDSNGNVIKTEVIHSDIDFSDLDRDDYFDYVDQVLKNYDQHPNNYVFDGLDTINILLIKKQINNP